MLFSSFLLIWNRKNNLNRCNILATPTMDWVRFTSFILKYYKINVILFIGHLARETCLSLSPCSFVTIDICAERKSGWRRRQCLLVPSDWISGGGQWQWPPLMISGTSQFIANDWESMQYVESGTELISVIVIMLAMLLFHVCGNRLFTKFNGWFFVWIMFSRK